LRRGSAGEGLAAEKGDFPGGVFALQRGEVHHAHGELEAGELGAGLDAAFAKAGGALLGHDLIHGRNDGKAN